MRIAVAGMGTESCTFSPLPTRLEDFHIARGAEMLEHGDYPFLSKYDADFIPTFSARALPGGSIAQEAYRQLKGELLERVRVALPLDGLYINLHGAMHVQGMEDAEADLLTDLRTVVGRDCLISASFDLHGNVSRRLVDLLDMLSAYRTAPHRDALETRERAVALLVRCLREGLRPGRVWVRIPAALPGERTATDWEPGASVYAFLSEVDRVPGVLDASLLVGYVWADEPRTGATAIVTGLDKATIHREAACIAQKYWDAREQFGYGVPVGTIDECIRWALDAPEPCVFISDSGDNLTAGAPGDLPIFLERLLALNAPDAVVYIADAEAVAACHAAGVGATVRVSLGGKLDTVHSKPLPVTGRVLRLASTDPVGGDQAVLQVAGVQVILSARRKPFLQIADFRRIGIEPGEHKIVVMKLGYLFPDLTHTAQRAFLALSPGAVDLAIERLPFRRVQRPLFPLDRDFAWQPPQP